MTDLDNLDISTNGMLSNHQMHAV